MVTPTVREHTALEENPSSISGTHMRPLTASYNSSSRGSDVASTETSGTWAHHLTQVHTHKQKEFKWTESMKWEEAEVLRTLRKQKQERPGTWVLSVGWHVEPNWPITPARQRCTEKWRSSLVRKHKAFWVLGLEVGVPEVLHRLPAMLGALVWEFFRWG